MNTAIWSALAAGLSSLLTFLIQNLISKHLERKAVSTAILAEIQRLLVVVATHHRVWQAWRKDSTTQNHPLVPFSCDVYEEYVDNLGLVQAKYVGLVVQFYGHLKFVNALQAVRAKEADFDAIYDRSLGEISQTFGQAFDGAFEAYGLQNND